MKKRREQQTGPGGEFLVAAARQKADSDADPSLLWYGGQACWSSVCVRAPVQTSSTLATAWGGGGEEGTVGRVCLRTTAAGGQSALRGGKEGRGGEGREVEQVG